MSLLGHASTAFPSYTHLLGYYHLAVHRELRIPVLSVAAASSEIATWLIKIMGELYSVLNLASCFLASDVCGFL
jgi:hypothetical protein